MSDEIQLNDDERELEAALRTLRPTPARMNIPTAEQAAGRVPLSRPATVSSGPDGRRGRWLMLAAAAAIVAAVGAWAALGSRDRSPGVEPVIATTARSPVEPLTLQAYLQALRQSPEELEPLLARQSMAGAVASRQVTPVNSLALGSFSSDESSELDSPVGEL